LLKTNQNTFTSGLEWNFILSRIQSWYDHQLSENAKTVTQMTQHS